MGKGIGIGTRKENGEYKVGIVTGKGNGERTGNGNMDWRIGTGNRNEAGVCGIGTGNKNGEWE